MVTWTVHVVILTLFNVNVYIEGGVQGKSTACPKELNAFSVSKTTSNASSDITQICSTTFGGCCNKRIERGMKIQTKKDIKHLIHQSNRKAKREFDIAYDVFKAFSENVLQETCESAIKYLELQLSSTTNIAAQLVPHIRILFKDLQTYLTENDSKKIVNLTNTFFTNFFPPLYKNHIDNMHKTELPPDFEKCLKGKMHLIKPFKTIPLEVTSMLERDLSTVQVFLRGLKTAGQVLHVIKKVQFSDNCTVSMVKMKYCPLCSGLNNSKPCLNYCSHIMSQCLKLCSDIQPYWDLFIKEMDELSYLLPKSLDATALFQKLQQKMSNAMSHVVLSPKMVEKHCGDIKKYKANKITTLKKKLKDSPTRDIDNGDLYLNGDLPSDIENQLRLVRNNLSVAQSYFSNISFGLCGTDGLASLDEDNCWNGTSLARYDKNSSIFAINMIANNSEVTKGALQLLQTAINEITAVVSRKDEDTSGDIGSGSGGSGGEEMWSGEPDKDGSGSGECDDSDVCGSSGSGKPPNVIENPQNVSSVQTSAPTTIPNGASRRCEYLTLICLFLWLLIWK